jgi:hypothetical protein
MRFINKYVTLSEGYGLLFIMQGGDTMINPGTWELDPMIKGLTYDQDFTILVNDVPKDLTNCTVVMELEYNNEAYKTLTSGSGLVVGTTTGAVNIRLSATDTATYPVGAMTYIIKITEADGITKYAYLQGSWPVGG